MVQITPSRTASRYFHEVRSLPAVIAALAVLVATSGCSRGQQQAHLPVIDTHIHLYHHDRLAGLPWPDKEEKLLYRSMLASDYNHVMDKDNVAGVIVVEASPRVSDNDWVLHHTKPYSDRYLGLIGALEFDQRTFKDDLERLCENPRFLGLRIGTQYLDQPHNPDYLKDPIVLSNLQLLSDAGKTLDVLIFKLSLDDVISIATKFPNLKIVINHLGNIKIDGNAPDAEWSRKMRKAATFPMVYCKVSSVLQLSTALPAPTDVVFYKSVLDTVYDCFGEDRLVYGSNWPCTIRNGDFSDQLTVVRDFFAPKGPVVLNKIFYQNAEKVYGCRLQ